MVRIKLAKITSQQMYEEYFNRREELRYRQQFYLEEINELNLRIVEWNCRNDEHNPVQVSEPLVKDEPKPPKPDMRGQWRRIKKNEDQ